ncbi:MAG: HD domain-containing protein [Actinomycetota bacterium]|nr:HD domain-containing protein [Actinomycetota bacterium]
MARRHHSNHMNLPTIPASWFLRLDGIDHSGGIHGRGHALRVWVHATELADEVGLPAWQREAVHYAALWHDIGRIDDGADYYHGARSGGRVLGLGLHEALDPIIAEAAIFAVTHHCGSEHHAELALPHQLDPEGFGTVFRILKDADALDRVRLGDLQERFLRFPQSRTRIERAWVLLDEVR